jgi:hypothetical protein
LCTLARGRSNRRVFKFKIALLAHARPQTATTWKTTPSERVPSKTVDRWRVHLRSSGLCFFRTPFSGCTRVERLKITHTHTHTHTHTCSVLHVQECARLTYFHHCSLGIAGARVLKYTCRADKDEEIFRFRNAREPNPSARATYLCIQQRAQHSMHIQGRSKGEGSLRPGTIPGRAQKKMKKFQFNFYLQVKIILYICTFTRIINKYYYAVSTESTYNYYVYLYFNKLLI